MNNAAPGGISARRGLCVPMSMRRGWGDQELAGNPIGLTPFGPRTVPVSFREAPARRGDTCPELQVRGTAL